MTDPTPAPHPSPPASAPRRWEWRPKLRWFAAEIVVVVAGVLIALALNAWGQGRQDRAREHAYLQQLRADLDENGRRLRAAVEDEERIGAAALAALRAVRSGRPVAEDSARSWIVDRRATGYSDPRVLTGTFAGLVASGDLQLFGDAETRNAVLAYLPLIEADRAEVGRFVDAFIEAGFRLRDLAPEAADYHPTFAETNVAFLQMSPVPAPMLQYLDASVVTSEVRMFYLQRMLAATESTAATLARHDPISPIQ